MTIKKLSLYVLFACLYLISSVPVGLFIYSLKSEADLNIFTNTGFHSYMTCLREEAEKSVTAKEEN